MQLDKCILHWENSPLHATHKLHRQSTMPTAMAHCLLKKQPMCNGAMLAKITSRSPSAGQMQLLIGGSTRATSLVVLDTNICSPWKADTVNSHATWKDWVTSQQIHVMFQSTNTCYVPINKYMNATGNKRGICVKTYKCVSSPSQQYRSATATKYPSCPGRQINECYNRWIQDCCSQ